MDVIDYVRAERKRQDDKWGEQNHLPFEWLSILMEEVGEAAKAANEANWSDSAMLELYRMEMAQVAAVAIAAIECLDRNWKPGIGE